MTLESELQSLIELAYQEDGDRDLTSEILFDGPETKEATILSKQSGIISGLKFVEQIIRHLDPDSLVDLFVEEGDRVKERMFVLSLEAKITTLLRAERVILNFLSRMSGIATLTSQYVKAIEGTGAVILDTRKTIPGWRYLDKYAVRSGGGINHRMNLSTVAMIKDTHVEAVGDVAEAVRRFRAKEMTAPLIVEVRDMKELAAVLPFAKSLTRIMLDNFTIPMMKEAVGLVSGKVLLEASGNITLDSAREIAETGVHFLSVGALTHSAPAFDLSFKI